MYCAGRGVTGSDRRCLPRPPPRSGPSPAHLRESDLTPQVTERELTGDTPGPSAPEPESGLNAPLPERLDVVLRDQLAAGESVQIRLHYGGQALVVTSERVMLIETGTVASSRAHWTGGRARSLPFPGITSADLRGSWAGGQIRITGLGSIEGPQGRMPAVEESVFTCQEERLKPLAKMAVEIIKARVKQAQNPSSGVPESSRRF